MVAHGEVKVLPRLRTLAAPQLVTGMVVTRSGTLALGSVSKLPRHRTMGVGERFAGYNLAGTGMATYKGPVTGQLWPRGDLDALANKEP